ncbi:hypothetical protein [Agrococcus versicolor]
MAPRRTRSLAAVAVGALALTGCIVQPPTLVPAPPVTEPTSQPSTEPAPSTPASSEPAPSSAAPSSAPPAASGGASIVIDGTPAPAAMVDSIGCIVSGDSAVMASGADIDDVATGFFTNDGGSWVAETFTMVVGDAVYLQVDETAPATYEGGVFTTTLTMETFTAGTATVDVTVPCGS